MSTAVEETSIEGISAGSPECEILTGPDFTNLCGNPADKRIRYSCKCGHSNCIFICDACFKDMRDGRVACARCELPGCRWTEI